MQLNLAFKPSAAMEFLPKTRPADYQAPKAPMRDKCPSGGPEGDDAYRSFKASLREADRRHEEAARLHRPDNVRRAAKDAREACNGPEARADATKPESDMKKDVERDNPDKVQDESVAEQAAKASSRPEDPQENIIDEHAGAEGVSVSMLPAETADPAAGLHSNSNAMPGIDAAAGANVADIPADNPALASGADSSDPKAQPTAMNESLIKPGSESLVGVSDLEGRSDNKNEPAASPNSGTDKDKPFDDLIRAASRSDHPGKSSPEGRPDTNGAAPLKSDAGEQLSEKIQSLQNLQEGQDAANQKHHGAKVSRVEDAATARTSEASTEQQNAGRIQGEIQQTREGEAKNQPVGSDEALPKLAKMTSGSKDSAFMHHQEQNFDRLMEQSTPTREKEAALGTWRAQTLDQIVNKAVYHLKNGQNEVLIDLKPEFLGQVRMQIVTHEHQVSVRIMAELPVVKEMLENNLQQLKAGLQQQGLEVDEIEVSVSADSQHNAQNGKMKSGSTPPLDPAPSGDGDVDAPPAPEATARMRSTNSAVDMFV